MFNLEALDVVIGMIFIYLLFSLLVSIVNEVLSQFYQVRGKELRFAIEKMLSEKIRDKIYEDSKITRSIIRSSFLYGTPFWNRYKNRKKKKTDGKKIINNVLPSQISTSTFSDVLVKLIEKDIVVINEYIEVIEENKESSVHSLTDVVRYISVPSRLEELVKEHEIRLMESEYDPNIKLSVIMDQEFLIDLLAEGHTNLNQLRGSIEEWYDEVMAYTSEWYKSKLKYILIVLGFITAVVFNIDSISVFKTLVNDEEARALVVQQAQAYVDSHESENGYPVRVTLPDSTQRDSTINGGYAIRIFLEDEFQQRFKNQVPKTFKSEKDSISITDSLRNSIQKQLSAEFPTLVKLDSTYKKLDTLIAEDIDQLSSILGMGWKDVPKPTWDGSNFRTYFKMLIGWLITAAALSLGAPFWFDLLKKVVNIRNELKEPKSETK